MWRRLGLVEIRVEGITFDRNVVARIVFRGKSSVADSASGGN